MDAAAPRRVILCVALPDCGLAACACEFFAYFMGE
jgi:hypothetical protein